MPSRPVPSRYGTASGPATAVSAPGPAGKAFRAALDHAAAGLDVLPRLDAVTPQELRSLRAGIAPGLQAWSWSGIFLCAGEGELLSDFYSAGFAVASPRAGLEEVLAVVREQLELPGGHDRLVRVRSFTARLA